MYGPLNGVRIALVVLAVIAVVTASVIGQTLGALILAAAVGVHAYGWMYLKRKAQESVSASETPSTLELGR